MAKLLDKFSSIRLSLDDLHAEQIEWLYEVKEAVPLLDWLTTNLDSSNCNNDRELRKYDDWCQDGKELCGNDLDKALEDYGIDVQKYLTSDLSQFDLELLDKELDVLQTQNDVALEIETLLSDEIQKSIENEEARDIQLKTSQGACQREGQNLMRILAPLKATTSNLFSTFAKLFSTLKDSDDDPDIRNCLLSNMPLEDTISTCEKFNEFASLCVKRKFEKPSYRDKRSVSELMSFLDLEASSKCSSSSMSEFANGLPNKMWKVGIDKVSILGSICGYKAAIQHLTKLKERSQFEKCNSLQMRMEITTLQDEISRLNDDIELILKHEVANIVEDGILHSIFSEVEKIAKERIERRQLLLSKLCSVATVTHRFVCVTDLLWVLLGNETRRLKISTDLVKNSTDVFTEELTKHKTTMNGLKNIHNDYNACSDALRSGQALLVGTVQKLLDITSDNCDSGNGTMSENQTNELEYIQLSDILESYEKQYAGRETTVYELLSELTNGPTKKPNLVKKELALAMLEVETRLKKYNADAENLASTFSSQQLVFKKSPVSKNRRLLWAWFLVAPDRLEEALRLAEESKRKK